MVMTHTHSLSLYILLNRKPPFDSMPEPEVSLFRTGAQHKNPPRTLAAHGRRRAMGR